jgi:hypothetical protein
MNPGISMPWPIRALAWLLGLPAAAMEWRDRRRARVAEVIYSPEMDTEHEAAAWLFERGAKDVSLWLSPGRKYRGLGVVR